MWYQIKIPQVFGTLGTNYIHTHSDTDTIDTHSTPRMAKAHGTLQSEAPNCLVNNSCLSRAYVGGGDYSEDEFSTQNDKCVFI